MRTTVTLDPDTEQLVRRVMRDRGVGFKEAINSLLRECVGSGTTAPFETEVASMGRPTVSLDRALQLVGDVEDDEIVRKARAGT